MSTKDQTMDVSMADTSNIDEDCFHQGRLHLICRTCGERGGDRYRLASLYAQQISGLLGVDIKTDSNAVHPKRVCPKCFKRFERYRQCCDQGKTFQAAALPVVPTFSPHSSSCSVCAAIQRGRPKKTQKVFLGPTSAGLEQIPEEEPTPGTSKDTSMDFSPPKTATPISDKTPLRPAPKAIVTPLRRSPRIAQQTSNLAQPSTSREAPARKSLFDVKRKMPEKRPLPECDRWYLKTKRLKTVHEYVDNFCTSNNESKGDVLHVMLRHHLLDVGQKDKAQALDNVMTENVSDLDVDECLAIRVNNLQTKNEYKNEYDSINRKTGRKVLQAPHALDLKEKSYVPPAARWSLIGNEHCDHVHHTPAKLAKPVFTHSTSGLDFEPINVLKDFHTTMPEVPSPNCKGVRWNYTDALAKTLEELEPSINEGLSAIGDSRQGENNPFIVYVKDGADGMGDVERHMEKSDRYLPDKAFRFSFAVVKITLPLDGEELVIFEEPTPSSVRVNRPLMVAIADENLKSSTVVCMTDIEYERQYMKDKVLKVHIPETGMQRSFSFKFFTSMIDEKFDRSSGGLEAAGSRYLCTLCDATRDKAVSEVGSFSINRSLSETARIAEVLRCNPDKLSESDMSKFTKGVKNAPILMSEPRERGIDATHADINMCSFFKSVIVREIATVNKWEATSDVKYLIDDATVKLDAQIKEVIGLNPAMMMPGNYARHMFNPDNENAFLSLIPNAERRQHLAEVFALYRFLRKLYRSIKPTQDYPTDVPMFKQKGIEMCKILIEHFSYVRFPNYLHKLIEHGQEIMEDQNGPGSIGAMSSEGNEAGNKVFRQLRKGHCRKGNTYEGLRDVLWLHWLYTSPKLCRIGEIQVKKQMCSKCYGYGHNKRTCKE